MNISGNRIVLSPALKSDRATIFKSLTQSDLTLSMMGLPNYPDHPIPTSEKFCREYPLSFFNDSGDGKGRTYMMVHDSESIGTVGYDLLDQKRDRVVLDIWMRSEKFCSKGYGSDGLNTLCSYLHDTYKINNFVISPSARNKQAVAAYQKAGFEYLKTLSMEE